jgi:oryzin
MATPHVVGLAAYMMDLEGLGSPAEVQRRIKELATPEVVENSGYGNTDALVFNGA